MSDIRVQNLSYAYPSAKKPVLSNIDLTIPRGEFVLVAGPSGCGKSTLALALAGLIPNRIPGPMRGQVYFGEKCISTLDIHETSQYIGMVFQNPDNQLIHLDVEAEVAFGPENLGLPRGVIRQRVAESVSYTHMNDFLNSPIHALSGGQKQRIAISATLAMRPNILVLDEPTSDLDPVGTQEVLQVLRRLNREHGMTIVLIEHKIDEVIPWVDRVLLMDEGHIVLDALPSRAFRDEKLWDDLGVSVPEMARLSHRLTDVFSNATALSVEEAVEALRGSSYQWSLRQRARRQQEARSILSGERLLDWKDVDLSFGERDVLKKTTLSLHAGEWLALAGPNGSGKTSLASLAMGFQGPTNGQVRFKDGIVKVGEISKQAKQIGYLFQAADNMLFSAKVRDELIFGKKYRPNGPALLQNMTVEELAVLIRLEVHLDRNPFELSHGQRKRLAIGALLAANPKLMILDEPTTGQDEGHAKAFLSFLQTLRKELQMTYLMITHDMRAVAQYASRLVVLNDGRIALNGAPREVFARVHELSEASIVPPPVAKLHATLCNYEAPSVALQLDEFLQQVSSEEVLL